MEMAKETEKGAIPPPFTKKTKENFHCAIKLRTYFLPLQRD